MGLPYTAKGLLWHKPTNDLIMENTFTKKRALLLIVMTLVFATGLRAQDTKEISGKVLNEEGLTIPGVTVMEKGTTNGK